MLCNIFTLFICYLSLSFQVYFGSCKDFHYIWISMLINRTDPGLDILERFLISAIVGHYDAIGLLVESVSYSMEALLSGSVPDLNLDVLSLG